MEIAEIFAAVGEWLRSLLPALLGLLLGRKQVQAADAAAEVKAKDKIITNLKEDDAIRRDIDAMPAAAVHDELQKYLRD